ncbi:AAA family ATPase [Rhodovulum steppense]|uniref:AAA family ATPase n=1 Tax=Rhodovulum steppense TaxID=540251 RepID=UPI001404E4A6|nr:AAA family ATPase [Rhodovulum steppense]
MNTKRLKIGTPETVTNVKEARRWARSRPTATRSPSARKSGGAPFLLSGGAASLLESESAKAVAEALRAAAEKDGPPALIVLDTLARNFGPGDENSTADMNRFVQTVDAMRGAYPGCTVIVVHHTGHGDKSRTRGSAVLRAALDAEYRVEMKAGIVTVTNTKMKEAPPPRPFCFEIQPIVVGPGKEGQPIGSAVLVEVKGQPRTQSPNLTPNESLGLKAFHAARERAGGSAVADAPVPLEA